MKKVLLVVIALFFVQFSFAQKLTVYIVRHAEKDISNTTLKDPELSFEGKQRALELNRILKGKGINDIFSTNYIRTRNTAGPLRDYRGLPLHLYDATKPADLVKTIKTEYDGKTLLIVGHSNTVLELIEAFGGKKPFEEIPETVYDNLFKLTINGDKISVSASKYGKKSAEEN